MAKDIYQQAADNLNGTLTALHGMRIMDLLVKELVYIDDIATLGIKDAILNRTASQDEILRMIQEMINDGYNRFSIPLEKEIMKWNKPDPADYETI